MGTSQAVASSREGLNVRISHFIPSVELKGSRSDQLQILETLIEHLEQLKARLSVDGEATTRTRTRPGRSWEEPAWPWFAAGSGVGALFVILLLIARSCA